MFCAVLAVTLAYSPLSALTPSLVVILDQQVGGAQGCILNNINKRFLQFHQSPVQIGVLFSSASAAYLVVALLLGPLSDKGVGYTVLAVVKSIQ